MRGARPAVVNDHVAGPGQAKIAGFRHGAATGRRGVGGSCTGRGSSSLIRGIRTCEWGRTRGQASMGARVPRDDRLAALVGGLPALRLAGVFVLGDHDMLERVAVFGPAPLPLYDRVPLAARLPVADVVRDGAPRYLEGESDWMTYPLGLRAQVDARQWPSVAVLPLHDGRRIAGAMYLGFHRETGLRSQASSLTDLAAGWFGRGGAPSAVMAARRR